MGGVAAGILFVLPGALAMAGLSSAYVLLGDLAWIQGLFAGLGPAVLALVASAVLRLGKGSLPSGALRGLAVAAFVAVFLFDAPFPAVVPGAALLGLIGARGASSPPAPAGDPVRARPWRVLVLHLALWIGPLAALAAFRGRDDLFLRLGIFLSVAAMVTFGGAYAVLAYVAQAAVQEHGCLGASDMTTGLGLDEPTPGPLILIVQWVGFLAGWRHPPEGWAPWGAALAGAGITLWVTFLPCFLWIVLGAPCVDRLRGRPRLEAALSGVSAAVMGVIAAFGAWLGLRILFGEVTFRRAGWLLLQVPDPGGFRPWALGLTLAAFVALLRFKVPVSAILAAGALAGLLAR
jgi:chromate transporter